MLNKLLLTLSLVILRLSAQEQPDSQAVMLKVLQRIDNLERENKQLLDELHSLRQEIAAASRTQGTAVTGEATNEPPIEDRVAVTEGRVAELSQTKVEAAQRFPISLTGTLLFNSFINNAGSAAYASGSYGLLTGPSRSGATMRQTLIGLKFSGPALPGDGRVHGSLIMDFGSGYAEPGGSWIRLRRADISLDWAKRSLSFRQDKPLIAPYQPDSLAEVIVPPLAGAGNLWLWLPQARYEERIHFGSGSGMNAQVALLQTDEKYQNVPSEYVPLLGAARPGLEGRVAFWHKFGESQRIELAPGFHVSSTHVAGYSVPSRLVSLDWKAVPWWKLELTGTAFHGQNAAGLGALGNGFSILPDGTVRPVRNSGGWAQIAIPLSNRLRWNIFGGLESDKSRDLIVNTTARNVSYASNLMYQLTPNVKVSFEALQLRSRLLSGATQNHNHYDLALAYLF